MGKIRLTIALGLLGAGLLAAAPAAAALNPSVVHCRALGYEYVEAETPKGPRGLCRLPGERLVDAWQFFTGRVAVDANYCGLHGQATRYVESGEACRTCAVCVLPDGSEVPVVQAMGLSFRESTCGDGRCGSAESFGSCPEDCVSGLYDGSCDGLADGTCDKDCQDMEQPDPDCKASGAEGCGCGAGPGGAAGAEAGLLAGLALAAWRGRRRVARAGRARHP
ncbi:MAG TPA: DUF333 domain-containing protein [Myxococcota bacterium]|nr:DUF333 domain-containing protein [Myxococcota bacterium]HRY93631.1 DUF333 domain-containing protein [Myxococcota bacterium]HSA24191.1 DUF333 domain-containing protein [Myxococcota bacterium]